MKTNRTLVGVLLAITFLVKPVSVRSADALEALSGKWKAKKVNDEGQAYAQTLAIKKDKFVFEILGAADAVILHAEGDVKLEALGPFKVIRFANLRAGRSASDLDDVNDEYVSIYSLDEDSWTLASGFDKPRDRWKPSTDTYRPVGKGAEEATLVIDSIEMAATPQSATWYVCFEASVNGVTSNYHVAGKGYEKSQVSIPVALELPKVQAGQKCSFKLQLDDVEGDECTDEVDNRSTGDFVASEKGERTFKPEDQWQYTIRWHLK